MNEMLIFFKTVPLAFNILFPVSFQLDKILSKFLFCYGRKPHDHIFLMLSMSSNINSQIKFRCKMQEKIIHSLDWWVWCVLYLHNPTFHQNCSVVHMFLLKIWNLKLRKCKSSVSILFDNTSCNNFPTIFIF